jgi:hypothetical protein
MNPTKPDSANTMLSELLLRELLVIEAASRVMSHVVDDLGFDPELRPDAWDATSVHRALTARLGHGIVPSISLLFKCITFGLKVVLTVPLMLILHWCWKFLSKPGNNPREMPPPSPTAMTGAFLIIGTVLALAIR